VTGVAHVTEPADAILITSMGKIIRVPIERIRQTVTRNTQGVKVIDLEEPDRVADITIVEPDTGEENGGEDDD
jgi:DNA gyrase subunit A